MVALAPATSVCKCAAPVLELRSAPLAAHQSLSVAMEQASRFTERAAQATAKTLPDAMALAQRFNAAHDSTPAAVARPMRAARGAASRTAITAMTQHVERSVALTTKDALALADRYQARAASATALKHEEALAFATRFNAQYNRSAAQNLGDALAFAGRFKERYDASAGQTLQGALAFAERFKLKANGLHLKPGATLREPGPKITARKGAGAGTKPNIPNAAPLAFQNALWTDMGVEIDQFHDIAAGGGYVWAVTDIRDHYRLYMLAPGSSGFVVVEDAPKAARVAAMSDGTPVLVTFGGIAIGRNAGTDWDQSLLFGYGQPAVFAIDVAAGQYGFDEILLVLDDGRLYDLFQEQFVPVTSGGLVRVAMAGDGSSLPRDSDKQLLPRVWAVDSQGTLYAGDLSGLHPVDMPWPVRDVGVDEQGVAFVIDDSTGNAFQLDTFGKRWLDTKGKANAIAAGADGSMWIVGGDGRVYNRGGRKFGFWELTGQDIPAPGDGWCDYLREFEDPANPLGNDALSRFIEGGASVIRVGQAFVDPAVVQKGQIVSEKYNMYGAVGLGTDVFLCIGVIGTGRKGVPAGLMGTPFNKPEMMQAFELFYSALVDEVDAHLADNNQPQRFEDVVKYIAVGIEVDYFMRHDVPGANITDFTNADYWDNWIEFYHQAAAYIRSVTPRVKVGSVMTLNGVHKDWEGAWDLFNKEQDPAKSIPRRLNEASGFVGFTTYPSQLPDLDDPGTTACWYDDPTNPTTSTKTCNYSVAERFQQMRQIAGDLPVVIEEFGYPSYDSATIDELKSAWPDKPSGFPRSFFKGDGQEAQGTALKLLFDAWDDAKVSVPVIVWFTAYEMHIEGRDCNRWPDYIYPNGVKTEAPLPANADPSYFRPMCQPCIGFINNLNCHMCGPGDGIDNLGTGTSERGERFFASCGLIRSDGVPKNAWSDVLLPAIHARQVPP